MEAEEEFNSHQYCETLFDTLYDTDSVIKIDDEGCVESVRIIK